MVKECDFCKKEFNGRQHNARFCSAKCKAIYFQSEKRKTFKLGTGLSYQSFKGYDRKLKLVEAHGGGCSICGYNKNLSALEFHHINPNTKLFNIDARSISNRSINVINEEVKKCILVCSNCHQEIHNPLHEISIIKQNLEKVKILEKN